VAAGERHECEHQTCGWERQLHQRIVGEDSVQHAEERGNEEYVPGPPFDHALPDAVIASSLFNVVAGLAASGAAMIFLLLPSRAHRLAALRILLSVAILLCGIGLGLAFLQRSIASAALLLVAGGMIFWGGSRTLRDAPTLPAGQARWHFAALIFGLISGVAWTISAILQLP
jgi:hypothetical protein